MQPISYKFSFFDSTNYCYTLFFAVVYSTKFYSTSNPTSSESNEIYNLIFFQIISYFLLLIFSLINPLYLFSAAVKGVAKRKSENKTFFDIKGVNIISLENKITPFLITFLYLLITAVVILAILSAIVFVFPITLYFFKFPFQIQANITNFTLYYGIYAFLVFNILYILFNPKQAAQTYFLKFSVYYWSIFIAFCICAIFIVVNMLFYFSNQEITSDILINKSKIAYAFFFNICFIFINYLNEKKLIF